MSDGVHAVHCCKEHGCKYGDDDCPVWENIVPQKHPCEYCRMAREEVEELLHEIFDFATDGARTKAFFDGLRERGLKVVKINE